MVIVLLLAVAAGADDQRALKMHFRPPSTGPTPKQAPRPQHHHLDGPLRMVELGAYCHDCDETTPIIWPPGPR
jgi:hypothetical protein